MGYECFELQVEGKVAHLKLSRPERRNAMAAAFWNELPAIVRELDASGKVRALVLCSTGPHFCAGLDLSLFQSADIAGTATTDGRLRFRRELERLQASLHALAEARFPVIAAIQGGCVGGGVDLISACDMRYATADSWYCIQEINIGMTADVGTLQRLPHLMPSGLVRELAYTGRRMVADEALTSGLVNQLFESQEAMLAHALETARTIASKSPLAIHGTKEMLNYTRDHSVADALNYMQVWQAGMFLSADLMEAITARQQKREPKFADMLPAKKIVRKGRR